MKKGMIIYQSKYGATRKYVQWLQEITKFDCVETPKASANEVEQYEIIILCGGIYASNIAGLSFLKEHIGCLKDKRIAILGVGATEYSEKIVEELISTLPSELKEIPVFYGRGAWDEGNMKFIDRILCKMIRKAVSKKPISSLDSGMKTLLSMNGKTCDWTDKKYLDSLLEYVNVKSKC